MAINNVCTNNGEGQFFFALRKGLLRSLNIFIKIKRSHVSVSLNDIHQLRGQKVYSIFLQTDQEYHAVYFFTIDHNKQVKVFLPRSSINIVISQFIAQG